MSERGMAVLQDLAVEFGLFAAVPPDKISTENLQYVEGCRSVVLHIMAKINKDPFKLQQEVTDNATRSDPDSATSGFDSPRY